MKLLSIKKEKTILSELLTLLNVKHTDSFSNKLYHEHPYKYNLFGISNMLKEYRVENIGIRLQNKNELINLDPPFLAQSSNDLVLVTQLTPNNICYNWLGKEITTSIEEFKETWSGVVLLTESTEKSLEPNYRENKKLDLLNSIQTYFFIFTITILFSFFYINQHIYNSIVLNSLLIINLTGIYISYC